MEGVNEKDAQLLLEALFQAHLEETGGFIEIREINDGNAIKAHFFKSTGDVIKALPGFNGNTYFGVCPRQEKKGNKEAITHVTCLWTDVDCGTEGHEKSSVHITKESALKALDNFIFKPSIVVDSGNGLHAYWILKEPGKIQKISEIEAVNKGIAKIVGGDNTHDLARILRLPGTFNCKDLGDLKPVKIIQNNDFRYNLDDFDDFKLGIKDYKNLPPEFSEEVIEINLNSLRIRDWAKHCIETGSTDGYDSRSERDHAVIGALINAGYDNSTIRSIFHHFPIGGKYREIGPGGDKYLACSTQKIRQEKMTEENSFGRLGCDGIEFPVPASLGDLIDSEIPKPEPLMEGLIYREELIVMSGPTKLGKTLLGMNLGLSLACGESWQGFKSPKPCKVLYSQQEVSEPRFVQRALKMFGNLSQDEKSLCRDNFIPWTTRGLLLDSPEHERTFRKRIEAIQPSLIVLDPLFTYHQGNENSAQEMGDLVRIVQRLIHDYQVSILIIHHFGKPSENRRYGGSEQHRGSSVIGGAADANWLFNRVSKKSYHLNDTPDHYGQLSFEMRNIRAPESLLLYRNDENLWFELVDPNSAQKVTPEDVINLLKREGAMKQTEAIEKLKELHDASASTVKRAITTAKGKGVKSRQLQERGGPLELYLDVENVLVQSN